MKKLQIQLIIAFILVSLLMELWLIPGAAQGEAADDFAQVDAYLEELRTMDNVPGIALAIVRDGEIVYERGYGYADAQGRPVTPETPMLIGSVSKSFTALAIMQLVEAGKLDLDAPVSRYLPWFERPETITVRHLLTQTSGFSTFDGRQDFHRPADDPRAFEKVARRLVNVPLANSPGEGWMYSNANYSLLGLLIERASGKTYEDYMAGHIFEPLGMNQTYTNLEEARANGMSSGYIYTLGLPVRADYNPYPRALLPGGYIISTAENMGNYISAMLGYGPEVISLAGLEELHHPQAKIQGVSANQYAFGWFVDEMAGQKLVWHSGDVPNFHANVVLAPESGWGVVLLINVNSSLDRRGIDSAAFNVMGILLGYEPDSLDIPRLSASNMYPIFMGVFGLALVIQIVLMIRSVRSLRRWEFQPHTRPQSGWRRWTAVLLPSLVNWGFAALLWFGVLHTAIQSSLITAVLFQPDVGILLTLQIALALLWGLVWTLWSGWLLVIPSRQTNKPDNGTARIGG